MTKRRLSRFDRSVIGAALLASLIAGAFVVRIMRGERIVIDNTPPPESRYPIGAFTGNPCEHGDRRPMAIMLASDTEARPLSGLGAADMVFELPVTPDGITRMMAIYQCGDPREVGSIRSARSDFIGLARSIDAILVHWGGERDALESLDGDIMDNIDALAYEGSTFYRKPRVPRPHDGFTTPDLLWERAQTLGYRASSSYAGFSRREPDPDDADTAASDVTISWPQGMDVRFSYDATTGTYLRFRGREPEIDALTGDQAAASVVIVITTDARFLRDQYITVRTTGDGVAWVYQDGRRSNIRWRRSSDTAPLELIDSAGAPVSLRSGTVWILFDTPLPVVP